MSQPVRMCVGCRRSEPKPALLRLAWADGRVVLDPEQRLPGRGCYLQPGCAAQALRRRAVGRALRRDVDAGQVARLLGG